MADRQLRVLMLAPTPFFADRGCHVRILEEARSLIRLGHQVRIVTYHLGRDLPDIPTRRIPTIPWYRKLAAGPSWHKPYLDVLLFLRALGEALRFRPNLLHAHLHEGAFVGGALKRLIRVPLLFDCQGSLTGELIDHNFVREGSLLQRFFARLERQINCGSTDFIITSSGPAAQDLVMRWGVPAERVQPLMDGVDTEQFRPYPQDVARQRLGLPTSQPLAVYLGVLNRYQGIDLLLQSMALLRSQGVPLQLLIMGFPEQEYRRQARQLGLQDSVHFTGRVDYAEAPRYLSAGDMAVSAKLSATEANGKLFNYMACGLPTVTFDNQVNREILGDLGIYAHPGDASDLAREMAVLAGDASHRQRLGSQLRERAVRIHSWTARGRELTDIYRRLLQVRQN